MGIAHPRPERSFDIDAVSMSPGFGKEARMHSGVNPGEQLRLAGIQLELELKYKYYASTISPMLGALRGYASMQLLT